MSQEVELYFDFVSPYSYLALTQAEGFAAEHGITWELRPVVYAALLDATGLVGPAEVVAKRRYTMLDIARSAELLGVPVVGPPAHPFRSLEALRTVCLFRGEPRALRLAVRISGACWAEGRDLTDMQVLGDVVEEMGLDAAGLGERITAPGIKAVLRQITDEALEHGVFGVPTFRVDGELFWGHDRLPHLAARLAGELPTLRETTRRMVEMRRGSERKRSPWRGGGPAENSPTGTAEE